MSFKRYGTMKNFVLMLILTVVCGLIISVQSIFGTDDYWTPPAGPGEEQAKMKTLNQIEPRTLILSLPFTITNSGSYYLVNTLEGTNGITINRDDVVLDLGGFSLEGLTNSGNGITVGDDVLDVTIRNGAVDEWAYGIYGTNADHFQILNVSFELNTQGGMRVGDNCVVQGCTATENSGVGIEVGEGGTVNECKVNENQSHGIVAGPASRIIGCTAMRNHGNGISVEMYSTVRDCTLMRNDGNGIQVQASCRVENNNCGDNGKAADGAGIHVTGPGNRIKDNNVTANKRGIDVGNEGKGNWIENNNVIDNNTGIKITGVGNFVIRNAVGTPLVTSPPPVIHFQITNNNCCAEILQNLGESFTNSNPWANIRTTPE